MKQVLLGVALVCGNCLASGAVETSHWWVYIGTYTGGGSEGIYLLRMDAATGALESLGLAAIVQNPSFLALHPKRPLLYAVGEQAEGGAVSAFDIADDGRLDFLNKSSSVGKGPCHVAVDRDGCHALVANYGGGSVAALPIDASGKLGPASSFIQHAGSSVNPHRQEGPHAHSVTLDAAGRFVFAADLGMDKIMVYRLSEPDGVLEPNEPPFAALTPGSGPRHFAFHPNGRFAYVINELSNTVAVFEYDADAGKLTHVETVNTLPEDFKGDNTTAEVRVHPSGRFVYGSNRGHDSIAVFQVNGETGGLTPAGHTSTGGKTPRNFGIDPSGRYLLAANQDTGNVVAFAIDRETGALTATGQEISVARPVCVTFCAGK